ncbi:MAG: SAM-dependent methyltransferase [Pseudonocardiaceae bacterium]
MKILVDPLSGKLGHLSFDGLEMVDPGLVPIMYWRPDTPDIGKSESIDAHGAVARKP